MTSFADLEAAYAARTIQMGADVADYDEDAAEDEAYLVAIDTAIEQHDAEQDAPADDWTDEDSIFGRDR